MDEPQRRDDTDPSRERDASWSEQERADDATRRREQERKRPALTRREREERWPLG